MDGLKKFYFFAAAVVLAFSARARSDVALDFDGDGRADPAVYSGGAWQILRSTAGLQSASFGSSGMRPVSGDFDGDGKADVAVQQQQTGNWFVFQSGSGNLRVDSLGGDGFRPVPADYDGDGKTDIAVFNRDTGEWRIKQSSDGQVKSFSFGVSGGRPVPADYDGDGKADLAVWQRETGNWFLKLSKDGSQKVINWGWRDARPVPADYDGDGKADIAVFNGASGNWYILNSSDGSQKIVNWGAMDMRPVPADYDGDGKADLAVYKRKTGVWYILQSSNGQLRQLTLGAANAEALPLYRDGGVIGSRILAFGDSITYGTSSSSNGPATGYPALLENKLNALVGGHFSTDNEGNPGEQTMQGLPRLSFLLSTNKPDVTLIMEGTNDEYYKVPFNRTAFDLVVMVALAKKAGASVALATIPPVISNSGHNRDGQEQLIEQFNPIIYKIGQIMNVPVVPVWESITAVPNWQNTLMDQNTANHPNDAGYQIVRDAFFQVLDQELQDGTLW